MRNQNVIGHAFTSHIYGKTQKQIEGEKSEKDITVHAVLSVLSHVTMCEFWG
jgi:hypothetical protein